MRRVALYHAQGCHLCEVALEVVRAVQVEEPFELELVDIGGVPELESAYRELIPVVEIDGIARSRTTFRATASSPAVRATVPRAAATRFRAICDSVVTSERLSEEHVVAERLTVGVAARLSRYLQVLTQAKKMGKERISSQEISEYTNINATQIRRDLSSFGRFGKRGVGYDIDSLLGEIRKILRTQGQHNIALVGAGRLGGAIASSPIFAEHGINVAAVFDNDPAKEGRALGGVTVEPLDRLEELVRERNIIVGVLAVPDGAAQSTCRCARRRRCEDHLQLLAGAAHDAGRRAGAHLEPRRRAPLRAVLPPDVTAAKPLSSGERLQPLSWVRSPVLPRMRILLWHGYLLGGTGSNVYTRMLAREWSRAGHDVIVLSPGAAAGAVRPRLRAGAPTRRRRAAAHVRDRPLRGLRRAAGPGLHAGKSSTAGSTRMRPRVRALLPADVVFTNHVLLGGPVGAATGALRRQGARLRARVLDARQRRALRVGRGSARGGAGDLRRLGSHPHGPGGGPAATSTTSSRCRRASTSTSGSRSRASSRSPRSSPRRGTTRRTPATPRSGFPTRATPPVSRPSSRPSSPSSSTSAS